MGSVGVPFEITPALDAVWGYQPSLEAMRGLLDLFAFDRSLVNDELARLRYEASIRPASRSPSAPCSRRAAALGGCHGQPRGRYPALPNLPW
jgi:hypothetical protein